ncbi:MAG: isoleucine--tRNA ligase, partial [bacterium]|nr:isoleucine--tRNA ligase [bacterium]
MAEKEEKKISFKDTLNLPQTEFPIRPQAKTDDPALIERWQKDDLYKKTFAQNNGADKFILHDGPPYANGHIHIGHAYNKILKDIITKSQRMLGKHVPVTPGWDCHGLPIEQKVTQENPGLSRTELKKACRVYAQKWVDIQREEFKQLGVLMDWDHPYLTMNFGYEASILRAFGQFVDAGYIERKNKTVPWCSSCQTVLATAEIEYEDRKDPSIYVLFPLEKQTIQRAFPKLADKPINVLIWTTTPWTLPLNRAVLLKPKAQYVVLNINNIYVAIGKELADQLCQHLSVKKNVVAEFVADNLVAGGAQAHHPFVQGLSVPLILDQSVMLEEGTAFVHSAPGVGPEDYEVGVKNNLEIFSPISPDGKYTKEIEPKELEGMSVADGQIWVIKKLAELDRLLFKTSVRHSYPHCWRCHNGLIFRATKQWFCDLSQNNLKNKTLAATEKIKTVPGKSINRLQATIEGRLEWCLSRQRVWGVPIPAIICTQCDYTYTTKELIEKVASEVEQRGIEYWDTVEISHLVAKDFSCPNCKSGSLKKEQDILDVWFDSGVSHFAVLRQNPVLAFPADMYIEGKDQHRGWFQSSLLTSMVLSGKPPMKTIVTHGFTVDEKGRKMSKSLGNVVSPQEMIDNLGTDGVRLWSASIDCSGEAVVSDILVRNVQEVFRKVRNTCRFLLSNLYDFDIQKDAVNLTKLRLIDQRALQELFQINQEVIRAYAAYDFTDVFHKLGDYCSVNLSSFYLDIVKDRLYVELPHGHVRRSAQTACWYILDSLVRMIAPVLSFTAEQMSDYYQRDKKESIHLQHFNALHDVWEQLVKDISETREGMQLLATYVGDVRALAVLDRIVFVAQQEERWQVIQNVRSAILKAIEEKREKNMIRHSLEARVTAYFDDKAPFAQTLHDFFKDLDRHKESPESFFKELTIVSQFDVISGRGELVESIYPGFYLKVEQAVGNKCPRCWQWEATEYEHNLCT